MKTKGKEVAVVSQEELALLNESMPVIGGGKRESFARLGLLSKDIVEESGKGKTKVIKIVQPAGTFFTNYDSGEKETTDEGKVINVWNKDYIEDEETIDVIIAFHRRQLRIFDQSLNKFIQTPVFDDATQIIPLFLDGREIARGTQEQLQARYPALTEKGKKTSKLKEEKILFVIYEGKQYQVNLSTSSKWAFQDYARKIGVAGVVTTIGSIEETFGTNTYRKMTFTNKRLINREELELVKKFQDTLKTTVESDKQFFLARATEALPAGKGKGKTGDADLDGLADEIAESMN